MATYPALDVSARDVDRVLAVVDDCSPTAVEDHDGSFTLYFSSRAERDEAWRTLAREMPFAVSSPREIDDEDWARRSQRGLTPVSVGQLTVSPPWLLPSVAAGSGTIVITPSMGFGTGHHATTRLCLGSGVLALAARRLGAQDAAGVDADADAVSAARENLALNPWSTHVRFDLADLGTDVLPTADVVTANLTGAVLVRGARLLMDLVRPGGVLVVSGLLADEQSGVLEAFLGAGSAAPGEAPPRPRADLRWSAEEDGWIGLVFNVGRDQPV
ncbi:MAG: hypothetical protein DMF90_14180 [Acidobacteria bacterium]|nr:MAG: hypothetical protein DMF90_14180 [Acidobacteriota bacterium]